MGAVPMAVPHTRPIAITPHANRPELRPRREPVAGRAARSRRARRRCSRCGWGSGATTRWASSPTSRTTWPRWSTPRPRSSLLEHLELGGHAHHRPRRAARGGRDHRGRGRPLPRDQRRGRRGRARRSSSSTTPSARPRQPAAACSPTTSRCRPARRSAAVRAVPGRPRRPAGQRRRRRQLGRPLMAGSADELVRAARPRAPRRRPLPRAQPRHRPPAGLRRPGGRAGAGRRHPHRRRARPCVHSLHSYFLRPGDTTVPIVYDVERIRDGRSFATRRVWRASTAGRSTT